MATSGIKSSGQNGSRKPPANKDYEPVDPEMSDLDRRRQALEDAMRQHQKPVAMHQAGTSGQAGFGRAMKLSTEFVAGILVGAGLGYLIDQFAGTTPWGMIIFLFVGFGAGIVNVLRAAGMVAEPEGRVRKDSGPDKDNMA